MSDWLDSPSTLQVLLVLALAVGVSVAAAIVGPPEPPDPARLR